MRIISYYNGRTGCTIYLKNTLDKLSSADTFYYIET